MSALMLSALYALNFVCRYSWQNLHLFHVQPLVTCKSRLSASLGGRIGPIRKVLSCCSIPIRSFAVVRLAAYLLNVCRFFRNLTYRMARRSVISPGFNSPAGQKLICNYYTVVWVKGKLKSSVSEQTCYVSELLILQSILLGFCGSRFKSLSDERQPPSLARSSQPLIIMDEAAAESLQKISAIPLDSCFAAKLVHCCKLLGGED